MWPVAVVLQKSHRVAETTTGQVLHQAKGERRRQKRKKQRRSARQFLQDEEEEGSFLAVTAPAAAAPLPLSHIAQ